MNLEPEFINIIKENVKNILPQSEIFIFGSRANNNNKEFSDVDIAIKDPKLDSMKLAQIKYYLEESDLPYKTDVVNYNELDSEILVNSIKI